MASMRDNALSLARQGFKVFPIKEGAKAPPLVTAWQQVATSDAAQVSAWWEVFPQANIGIHADGLLILDVDTKKDGYDSLAALELEVEIPQTLEVSTPSGGRHIYLRAPAGSVRNGVSVLGQGIDVRATGGYVVAPGSVTPAGTYQFHVSAPVADAPDALIVRCRATEPKAERDAAADQVQTNVDYALDRAREFLRGHAPAVEGSGGNHHTFATVCRVRDLGVPQDRAAEALEEWNETCQPPWDHEGLATVIRNAYKYAQEPAGKLTPEKLFDIVPESVRNSSTTVLKDDTFTHPADITEAEIGKVEYLIKGVLEKESNAILFGTWNVGKTFIVLDMAASVCTGTPWFGKRVTQGRVLYFGYEGLRGMKKRLYALRGKYPGLLDRRTPFGYRGLTQALTSEQGVTVVGDILTKYAATFGGPPDLVVIDTLTAALGGDDSDAQMISNLDKFVRELMTRQKCTVLRVHHSGHGDQERSRGHSSLAAGIDTEIKAGDGEITLKKQRDNDKGSVQLYFTRETVKVTVDTDGDDVTTCIIVQVDSNPASPDLTPPQRGLMDTLLENHEEGDQISAKDIQAAAKGLDPAKRKEFIAVLERKSYLRKEGKGWVICERGPESNFDDVKN